MTASTDEKPSQKRRREIRIPGDDLAPALPHEGYVRVWQIVGDPKAKPPIPGVLPMGESTWWRGVKEGRFPKPVKLGPQTTAWRVQDIRQLLETMARPAADTNAELKAA